MSRRDGHRSAGCHRESDRVSSQRNAQPRIHCDPGPRGCGCGGNMRRRMLAPPTLRIRNPDPVDMVEQPRPAARHRPNPEPLLDVRPRGRIVPTRIAHPTVSSSGSSPKQYRSLPNATAGASARNDRTMDSVASRLRWAGGDAEPVGVIHLQPVLVADHQRGGRNASSLASTTSGPSVIELTCAPSRAARRSRRASWSAGPECRGRSVPAREVRPALATTPAAVDQKARLG